MTEAIKIADLVVRRGDKEVLHGLNCSVSTGSVTGLLR